MEDFDPSILEVIEKADEKFPDNISQALDWAEQELEKLPVYKKTVSMLIRKAIKELIYDYRHKVNVQTKRQTGYYGQGARVQPGSKKGTPSALEGAYRSVYDYRIGSTRLGELTGKDLSALREQMEGTAKGFQFNAELLQRGENRLLNSKESVSTHRLFSKCVPFKARDACWT